MLIHEENSIRKRNQLGSLKPPSHATLSTHIHELVSPTEMLAATKGERHARNRRGRGSTDIRALFVGEYVEIDECKASLVASAKARGQWESLSDPDRTALEDIDKEIRTRLSILVMIDVATRMPLAWVISDQLSDAGGPSHPAIHLEKVVDQGRRQNMIGIHFDECQHVFSEKDGRTNSIILDSLKTLLKDSRWPLILILSGIPALATHVQREEQLARLLRPVHFDEIIPDRDIEELNQLAFAFADRAGLDFEPLSNADCLHRLSFACANRWGLVIELLIEALTIGKRAGAGACSAEHFDQAFSATYGTPVGYSPFTLNDYRDGFDQKNLLALLNRAA